MAKRKWRDRERSEPSTPTIIDTNASEATEREVVPGTAPTVSAAPALPVYSCTVTVFDDKVEILPSIQGKIKAGRVLGWRMADFVPDTKTGPSLKVMSNGPQQKRADLKRWTNKWLARIGAMSLWLMFSAYLFRERGVVGLALAYIEQDASWEPYLLLVLVAVLLAALSRRGPTWAILAILYIAFLPMVAVFVFLSWLFGTIRLLRQLTAGLMGFAYRGANWILMIVSCAAIAKTASRTIVIASIIYLSIGTIYLMLSNFIWVTRPLSTVFALLGWLDSHSGDQLEKFKVEFGASFLQYRSSKESRNIKSLASAHKNIVAKLDTAKVWHSVATGVQKHLRRVVAPVVLFYLFAFRFLVSIVLITIVFASIYFGMSKTGLGSFAGTGLHTFSEALYFSAVTFCTVGYGDVTPMVGAAQWTVIVQMGTGLVMLTLLALSFSTLSTQTTTAAAERMETSAKQYVENLKDVLRRHLRIENRSLESVIDEVKKDPTSRLMR